MWINWVTMCSTMSKREGRERGREKVSTFLLEHTQQHCHQVHLQYLQPSNDLNWEKVQAQTMPQSQELAGKTHQTTIVVLQMGNMQANLEQLLQHNLRTPKKNQKTTNQFVCNLQPTSKTLSLQWCVSQSTVINRTQLHWKSSVPPTTYLPKTLNCDDLIPQCASKSALMEQKRQHTHKLLKGLAPCLVQHW